MAIVALETLERGSLTNSAPNEAVHINPKNSVALYIGCAYIRANKHSEAIEVLEKAKQMDENNAEIRLNLGFALKQQKRYRGAIAEMQKAVSLDPNDNEARFLLGRLYIQTNDRESALAQYAKLKLLNPQLDGNLYQAIYGAKIIRASNK